MLKFFASPKPKRRASFEDDKVLDTVKALQSLQQTLHKLSPAEQSRVKHELSFASAEWLEGLALSIKAQAETTVVSLDGSSHSERARTGRFSESATDARIRLTPDSGKVVLVLVGLPARGKSLLCHKLEHFLSWRGYVTKAFKVGSYRRGEHKDGETSSKDGEEAVDIADPQYPSATDEPRNLSPSQDRAQFSSASFFDSTKAFAALSRETVSLAAFDELLAWLTGPDNGQVAIFDASNVTVQRRAKLQEKVNALKEKASVGLVFIETICTDEEVIHDLKLWKVRNSPDFAGMTEEAALADLHDRIGHYEKVYQTVLEDEGPYIKLFDLRAKVAACNIYGRMAKSVMPYLLATHAIPRPLLLLIVPADKTEGSVFSRSDGHDGLVRWAKSYARAKELVILTSNEPRAVAAAGALADAAGSAPPAHRSTLAPLVRVDGGKPAEGAPSPSSFKSKFGESVSDLVVRLEPIVLEFEGATSPVLIVAQEAPCRTLRAYLLHKTLAALPVREVVDDTFTARLDKPQLIHFEPTMTGGFVETVHDLE